MEVARKKKKSGALAYLTPALVTISILTIAPIIFTIIISFTDYSLYSKGNLNFVGLENFTSVLTGNLRPIFLPVFGWTIIFAVASTAGCFLVGLFLALLVENPNIKERAIYKAILILPWALPVTIAILSFQGLLNGSYGQINTLLLNLHIIKEPIMWLTDPNMARFALIMVNIWLGFPYMMNICIGAINAIPTEYYEAADVDGASKLVQFFKITLPSIAQTAWPLIISSFAFNFNNFGSAYLITNGNPARTTTQFAGYTDILASVNYKLITVSGKYSTASAISILIFILLAAISFFQLKKSGQFSEVD